MERKNLRLALLVLFFGVLAAGLIGYYIMFLRPKPDIAGQKASFMMSASEIAAEFAAGPDRAHQKFSGKVVEIFGKVGSVDTDQANQVHLFFNEEGATVQLSFLAHTDKARKVEAGDRVRVKGNYTGFHGFDADDLIPDPVVTFSNGLVMEHNGLNTLRK